MHVPQNVSLSDWIRQLDSEGKLYRFYKTDEWRDLRAEVMADHGHECEAHAARGKYARADTVHHEFHVRSHPSMALTRWVIEPDGSRREVLHPLCNDCHNEAHGRKLSGGKRKRPPLTEERW